jgi:hypothetical protein
MSQFDDWLGGLCKGYFNVTGYLLKKMKFERFELEISSFLPLTLSGREGILHKHGYCHWTYTARNWGDVGRNRLSGLILDIANQSLPRLFGRIFI